MEADTRKLCGVMATQTGYVPSIPLDVVAVMVASPNAVAFTTPFGDTVATASSLDDHVMVLSVVSSGINSAVSVIVLFLQKGFVLSQSEHNFRLFARTGCTVN